MAGSIESKSFCSDEVASQGTQYRPRAYRCGGIECDQVIMFWDYWSRIWIIQEVALAQEIWIQCGFQATLLSSWRIHIRHSSDDRSATKRYLADEIASSLPGQFFDDRLERATQGRESSPLLVLVPNTETRNVKISGTKFLVCITCWYMLQRGCFNRLLFNLV
jgi:hypothetical protein